MVGWLDLVRRVDLVRWLDLVGWVDLVRWLDLVRIILETKQPAKPKCCWNLIIFKKYRFPEIRKCHGYA
jgi:hypothetical protein